MSEPSINDDFLDSREIDERINELESELEAMPEAERAAPCRRPRAAGCATGVHRPANPTRGPHRQHAPRKAGHTGVR